MSLSAPSTVMNADSAYPRYVIVSPVKDEERFIDLTLRSVTSQTVKPVLWVIVDDGSTDDTQERVRQYATEHSFIRLVSHPNASVRLPGAGVITAFNYGRAFIDAQYDFIVKLDCDLSFEPDYFERLFERFDRNTHLGIASGVYLEQDHAGDWKQVPMPAYHAFGASKVVRRRCFEEISGFPVAPGWDTADEIRGWARGWKSGHFPELQVRHHKREGSGIGPLRTSRMHGEIYYRTGGDPLFFVFKVIHRLTSRPWIGNAVALLIGYVGAMASRKPRLVTPVEARHYRRLLRRRLLKWPNDPAALNPVRTDG